MDLFLHQEGVSSTTAYTLQTKDVLLVIMDSLPLLQDVLVKEAMPAPPAESMNTLLQMEDATKLTPTVINTSKVYVHHALMDMF